MPNNDVFISYSRSERAQVSRIAELLHELGLSVWLDAKLDPGNIFDDEINREVRNAKAILVCWTPEADASEWVRAEAMIGVERGVLVPVLLNPTDLRPPFNIVHAEDLIDWQGDPSHPGWTRLLDRLQKVIHRQIGRRLDFTLSPKARIRIPPPRQGECWIETALFRAGRANFPPWTESESFLTAFEWSTVEQVIFTAGKVNGLRCWTERGTEIERMKIKRTPVFTSSIAVADSLLRPLIATAGHGPLCIWRQGWYEKSSYVLAFQHDLDNDGDVTALAWQPAVNERQDIVPLAASVSHRRRGAGSICLWDVRAGVKTWSHPCHVAHRLHWSPTGEHLAAPHTSGHGFEIFERSGERLSFKTCDGDHSYDSYNPTRAGFAWHQSGRYFATGMSDFEIGIFELASLSLVRTLVIERGHRANGAPVASVQWAPDGRSIAVSTAVGTTVVFDVDRGTQQSEMYGTSIGPNDLAFSPDGQRLATRGKKALRLWDPFSGKEVASVPSADAQIRQIYWHPNSQRIAFGHDNGRVKIAQLEF